MDPIIAEAILSTLRVLTLITGSLVLIDAIGILLLPAENPPHKPKWAALSWCIVAATVAGVSAYLLTGNAGLVGEDGPFHQKLSIWIMYAGLTTGFTCRAISRAHRPLYTVAAVLGLSAAGVFFAVIDIVG